MDLPLVDGRIEAGVETHIGAIVWVRGETFKAESETTDLWQPRWNENQTVLAARQECKSPGRCSGWELGFRDCGAIPGEGCYRPWRDGSQGCDGGDCGGKCLWRKARQPRKQGDTAESCVGGGAITIASQPPKTTIHSWTIESLSHQTTDALNYRVGPHPGSPFKCLTCITTE